MSGPSDITRKNGLLVVGNPTSALSQPKTGAWNPTHAPIEATTRPLRVTALIFPVIL